MSPLVAALATASFVAACAGLGCWQLDRARQKQALIDAYRRGDAGVVDVTTRTLDGLPRYQTVSARGAYEPRRQILLDNMPSSVDGRPGYRVLTPFRRATGGALLLVDRGWIPLGDSREQLPAVQIVGNPREIAGRIDRPPAPGLRVGTSVGTKVADWPRVMNFPTTAELVEALGDPVEGDIVLLHPGAPDGYERKWQPTSHMNPARHIAYAIQWFAFGIIAAIVLLVANLRRRRARDGETP